LQNTDAHREVLDRLSADLIAGRRTLPARRLRGPADSLPFLLARLLRVVDQLVHGAAAPAATITKTKGVRPSLRA
jgi:hypothetical protein